MRNLPGEVSKPDHGATCDYHPDIAATVRVQGETDSFGAEYIHMCTACKQDHDAYRDRLGGAVYESICQHSQCRASAPVFPVRDFEEGVNGPVYYYCRPCKAAFLIAQDRAFERLFDSDFHD